MSSETADLIARFSAPVPRYTSYPTAPHFSTHVGNRQYAVWLGGLPADAELSLYLHVPFCHELCWYCGCNTKAAQRYAPITRYLAALLAEAEKVSRLVPAGHGVSHIHWGGGSPNKLSPADIGRVGEALRARFRIRPDAEIAAEIDPRHLDEATADAFAAEGVTRVSIGVQDFDEAVQRAINRIQPYEMTRRAIALFRAHGVRSLNVDLIYGLPHQTLATYERTIDRVLELSPDRIAVFGYAHLPSRIKHQRMIDTAALPKPAERYRLAERAAERFVAAGYVRVGLDHFAKPEDTLAKGPVARNFQGYTTDCAAALIGLGASSIGRVGGNYVQNATPIADYVRRIESDGLAVARGLEFTPDDRLRAAAIEQLMCGMALDLAPLERRFGGAAAALAQEAEALVSRDRFGLVERTGSGFKVTERGRPFLRSVCAAFDAHLPKGIGQHAAGV